MICGHCHTRTSSKEEVRLCYERGPGRAHDRTPSTPTRQFIRQQADEQRPPLLEPDPPQETYAERYARRTKSPDLQFPAAMALKIMEEGKQGYYAARVDDNSPYEFFRISRPVKGKWAGVLKIQTIHGDKLEMFLVIRPDGSHWAVEHKRTRFEEALTMVVVDPRYAQNKFAEIKQRCCNCGKGLTDDRSLWYGIGPECEQFRQDIIALVVDEKGEYAGPQGISA